MKASGLRDGYNLRQITASNALSHDQPESHVNLSQICSSEPDQKEGPKFMQRLVAKQKGRVKDS